MTEHSHNREPRPFHQLESDLDALQAQAEADDLAEFQELVWALLEQQISEPDRERLERVLRNSDPARRLYAQCQQIHADLQVHFRSDQGTDRRQTRPPLPFLDMPDTSMPGHKLPPS